VESARLKGILAGSGSVLIWSLAPLVIKRGVEGLPILFYLFFRFLLSTTLLLPWARSVFARRRSLPARDWLLLTLILGANYSLQTWALEGLPASWYIAVFSLHPLLALAGLRVRFSAALGAAIALSIAGAGLFVGMANVADPPSLGAWLALFGGMLTWVLYTLVIRRFQRVYSDVEVTALTTFLSFVFFAAAWAATGFAFVGLTEAHFAAIGGAGLLLPVAFFLFSVSLRETPVFCVMSQYLEPVIGLLGAVIFLGEGMTPAQVGGGLLILAGTLWASRRGRPAAPEATS